VNSEKEKEKDREHKISDLLKKAISVGVGAAFITEDAVKNLLQDLPLPKDILNGLLQNAKQTKKDLVYEIKQELGQYLKKIDLKKMAIEVLQHYDLEVKANISFVPKNKKQTKKQEEQGQEKEE